MGLVEVSLIKYPYIIAMVMLKFAIRLGLILSTSRCDSEPIRTSGGSGISMRVGRRGLASQCPLCAQPWM